MARRQGSIPATGCYTCRRCTVRSEADCPVASLFTRASRVEVIVDVGFGEGDGYLNIDRDELSDKQLLKWLKEIF